MSQQPHPTPELPPQEGISLHELTQAFAKAMGYQPEPEGEAAATEEGGVATLPEAPAASEVAAQPAVVPETPEAPADDSCPISPTSILEAMLFVGNRDNQPLTAQQAADLMRGVSVQEVPDLVATLNRRYEMVGCPYEINSQTGGYRMVLRREFSSLRDRFYGRIREARLSQSAVDVLAIVAYQQPVTADQITRLRGKPSGRLLTQLVRRGLLRVERSEGPPKVLHYLTAGRFLDLFGLKSLEDLPKSEDLE